MRPPTIPSPPDQAREGDAMSAQRSLSIALAAFVVTASLIATAAGYA
jgi:hypothetical protein